jgi:hypothetical protein
MNCEEVTVATKEPVKGTYQHYKGTFYEVLGIADDPETGQRWVVYQDLGITENLVDDSAEPGPHLGHRVVPDAAKSALAVCSVARFTELVDGKEYSGGKRVPRFKLVARMPPG